MSEAHRTIIIATTAQAALDHARLLGVSPVAKTTVFLTPYNERARGLTARDTDRVYWAWRHVRHEDYHRVDRLLRDLVLAGFRETGDPVPPQDIPEGGI